MNPSQNARLKPWLDRLDHPGVQATLLVLATLAGYYHTLDVPFYLDDFHTISDRALLYKENDIAAIWAYSPARFIAFFSFYLNYKLDALNLAAYHAVNIGIHCLAGLAAFWLTRLLQATPALEPGRDTTLRFLPLVVAMLFLLHPLQTQAVTYVVQRMTSLAALFYLGALACYVRARLAKAASWWYLAAVLLALAGFITKQNTFTLPLAIMLVELLLFRQLQARPIRLLAVLAGIGATLLMSLQLLYVIMGHREWLTPAALLSMTTETGDIGRALYFYSQQEALWRYIGLFFWPVGQRLDYAIAAPPTLWLYPTVVFFLGHLALLYAAFLLRTRLPLVAFGLIFYYLAHAVESSILPIRDLMFEHRAYLPNYGLALAVAAAFLHLAARLPASPRRWLPAAALAVVAVTLTTVTWKRNNLWRDDVAFLADNARLSPVHFRPYSQLGLAYMNRKQYRKGVEALQRSIEVYNAAIGNTGDYELPPEIFTNLLLGKTFIGQSAEVLDLIDRLLAQNTPSQKEMARLRLIQGAAYFNLRKLDKAETYLREAMALDPNDPASKVILADTLKMTDKAAEGAALDKTMNQLLPYMTIRR